MLKNKFYKVLFTALFAVVIGLLLIKPINLRSTKENVTLMFTENVFQRGWNRVDSIVESASVLRLISPQMKVDQIYHSMAGPAESYHFAINKSEQEMVWITNYEVTIIKDGIQENSEEFLCHNNFDYAVENYFNRWYLPDRAQSLNTRMFTLTQGQSKLKFPTGFGIPMMSDESLSISAQVLNHNQPNLNTRIQQIVDIHYVKNIAEMKPLFHHNISVMPIVEDSLKYNGWSEDSARIAVNCAPAPSAVNHIVKVNGKKRVGHWVIHPGKEVYRIDVTPYMQLPFNTTLHYAGVHIHPYADSLILEDITDNRIIFCSKVVNFNTKIGTSYIEALSSKQGVMMHRNHQYELTCYTNNTSGRKQDMMAVMLMYFYDKDLDKKISAQRL